MFENCFSLGANCDTASSLSQLGLRSIAAPFDWIETPCYSTLLAQFENGFTDFMKKENLACNQDDPKTFSDRKYSFSFIHDVKNSYEDEIDEIIKRYQLRTRRFMQLIRQPSVFFRCVSEKDIDYINANWKYAEEVVKQFNDKNEIVYILYSYMNPLTENVRFFRLPVKRTNGSYLEMRHLLEQSDKLLEFCNNLIDEKQRNRNLAFDEATSGERYKTRIIIRMLSKCINIILSDYENGAYIWETGHYTADMIRYVEYKNNVLSSCDNTDRNRDNEIILINKASDIEKDKPIFIPHFSGKEINSIKEQIRSAQKNNLIFSFNDMYPFGIPPVKDLLEWDS